MARNANIYEFMDNGGSVMEDLADLSFEEMEDYFGDQDPCAFL